MNVRIPLFACIALALAGCNEDPQVITVAPSTGGVNIAAGGGSATLTVGTGAGTGGAGGKLDLHAVGDLQVGGSTVAPAKPTAPKAPTFVTGDTDVTSLAAPVSGVGNVFVRGTVTTASAGPVSITSSGGDVVISGTLRVGAVGDDLTVSATAGTVYVSGKILTSLAGGALSGNAGSSVTIHAGRIVVTGTIDTRGEAFSTGIAGDGGDVTLDMVGAGGGTNLFLIGGTINSSGGAGRTKGGKGGAVALAANNSLHAYGTLITSGGAASSSAADSDVTGGDAGSLTLTAGGSADLLSTVTLLGGNASTNGSGATGGAGGVLSMDGTGLARIYSALSMNAGKASAAGLGLGLKGGDGGIIQVGLVTKPATLEIGRGNIILDAGSGTLAGGDAQDSVLDSQGGLMAFGCAFSSKGGDGAGSGDADGGLGGGLSLETDMVGAGSHSLSVLVTTKLDTSGGSGVGTGVGKLGGSILLKAAGDVLLDPLLVTTKGGASPSGDAGAGGDVKVQLAAAGTPIGDLTIAGTYDLSGGTSAGANATGGKGGNGGVFDMTAPGPNGELSSTAIVTTSGGAGALAGNGGDAGKISFLSVVGGITSSGNLTAKGGAGNVGTGIGLGGAGKDITFDTTNGSIVVSGTLEASGGTGTGALSGAAGNIHLAAATDGNITASGTWTANGGGNLTSQCAKGGAIELFAGTNSGVVSSSASISAKGGSSLAATAIAVHGGDGGSVTATALAPSPSLTLPGGGSITLAPGSSINLDGGTATGNLPLTSIGGIGGTVTLTTADDFISISGSINARGGSSSNGGIGGGGGQVLVDSDNFAGTDTTAGGDITLQSGASIDVSGAAGTLTGGSAVNDGAGGVTTPVAVSFDADNGTAKVNGGKVQNLGTITAAGGTGGIAGIAGDVLFDGLNGAGGALPVRGTINPNPGAEFLGQ